MDEPFTGRLRRATQTLGSYYFRDRGVQNPGRPFSPLPN